jgi:hypothetical protein
MSEELREATKRKGSFLQTIKAVGWSFFGMRRGNDYERDVTQLNPIHVIIAGVLGAAIFVVSLIFLVRWMVGK